MYLPGLMMSMSRTLSERRKSRRHEKVIKKNPYKAHTISKATLESRTVNIWGTQEEGQFGKVTEGFLATHVVTPHDFNRGHRPRQNNLAQLF